MPEITINLHMHSCFSDGTGTHQDIADAALKTGLDAVIVTDHNILVKDQERYYTNDEKRVLLLVGEEIHDPNRVPVKNHLLVFDVDQELADEAGNPDLLIQKVNQAGGMSFLAHPTDPAAPLFNEKDYSWVDWNISDFTGLELWNGFSEFKTRLNSKVEAVFYAFNPNWIARGPMPNTLDIWDRFTGMGQKIVAIGGSDAHARQGSLGPFKRIVFPYEFHFQAINTHLIIPEALNGNLENDKRLIYNALRQGHAFVGYDLPSSTNGFQFKGIGKDQTVIMGDEMNLAEGITLEITLPIKTECALFKDGDKIKTWQNLESCSYTAKTPGVYRVEVYITYKGTKRGWIYSNPIYIRE